MRAASCSLMLPELICTPQISLRQCCSLWLLPQCRAAARLQLVAAAAVSYCGNVAAHGCCTICIPLCTSGKIAACCSLLLLLLHNLYPAVRAARLQPVAACCCCCCTICIPLCARQDCSLLLLPQYHTAARLQPVAAAAVLYCSKVAARSCCRSVILQQGCCT
eukprot:COSAG02_NODE_6454_length_3561_cov_3.798094_3_plen_163_part_00